jgi:predicted ATP-grasp superfamily ATP-dependent carboligase
MVKRMSFFQSPQSSLDTVGIQSQYAGLGSNLLKHKTGLSNPPVILFGGSEGIVSVARSLSARFIPVYVLNKRWAEIGYSRYTKRILLPKSPTYPQSALEFLMGSASDHLRGSVLLAGLDEELKIVAEHRKILAKKFRLDLSNPAAQLLMLDKLATYEAACEAGVTTPKFWKIESERDIHRLRDSFVYPLIIKPKLSHPFQAKFAAKFITVRSYQQLLDGYHIINSEDIKTLLVEKIPGPDSNLCSYYTYLDEDGKALFDFTKRIIRRYPKNMGIASYHITDRVAHVRELSLRLLRHVGLRGLANVEFKFDERDRQLKLIECNSRFTAANGLLKRAGYDLGNFVYNRIVGIPQPMLTDFHIGLRLWDPQRDFLAFMELRKRGEITAMQWLRSIMHKKYLPLFSWRDPGPSLVRLGTRTGKAIKNRRLPNRLPS